ncbi:MAG: DUF5674 family protein [candidate division Zixibacteria bacterium]|nr:DUF5674 family protein [candidate division Zixibacteria bacterium]
MQILTEPKTIDELRIIAKNIFENLVKAVVDVRRGMIAIDAEMHADLEAYLIESGSTQSDLWGINLLPFESDNSFLEFDSMINIRPSQNNRSRTVEDTALQERIAEIVSRWILK